MHDQQDNLPACACTRPEHRMFRAPVSKWHPSSLAHACSSFATCRVVGALHSGKKTGSRPSAAHNARRRHPSSPLETFIADVLPCCALPAWVRFPSGQLAAQSPPPFSAIRRQHCCWPACACLQGPRIPKQHALCHDRATHGSLVQDVPHSGLLRTTPGATTA